MRLVATLGRLAACLGLTLLTTLAAAQSSTEELQRQVTALQEELARLKAAGTADARLSELERRIDLLAAEVEKSRTGGASDEKPLQPVPGFAPAAAKVYGTARGVSIGGYGEANYQNFAAEDQSGQPTGALDRADFLRAVLYVGYKFDDRILFNSELEVEHATTGEGDEEKGEVSIELAYLEFKAWKTGGLRAGMLLVPLGFVNELHEPPVFDGVRRPDVERLIIPTTWHEVGLGAFGENGPLQWRAYVVPGLDSAGFEGEGLREGRQQGSESLAQDLAFTGRLDYAGLPGLLLGASVFTGNSGQGAELDGQALRGRVTIYDVHAQYQRRGLQLRGLYARTSVDETALINARNGLAADESVGERQWGGYLEAAYDLLGGKGSRWSVTPFVRYEALDTQDRVPAGAERDPGNDTTVWTAGIGVKPLPQVVLKADYQWLSNGAKTGRNQLNLGLGYLF